MTLGDKQKIRKWTSIELRRLGQSIQEWTKQILWKIWGDMVCHERVVWSRPSKITEWLFHDRYLFSSLHDFCVIISPNIMTEEKGKGYQQIGTIKTFE